MNKIILVLSFLFIVFGKSIFAQKQHGILLKTDSSIISSHNFESPESLIYLDTTLNNFHQFHPAYQQFKTLFYFDLGNLGQPIYTYNQKLNTPFGFNFQKPEYDALRFDIKNMLLYQTNNKVYSELFYTIGLKSESMLDAHHSQKINKNILLDARYRYMNAEGIYLRQLTQIH
ncbi:MAG: putative porin, partial [Bacteroidota bacterium]